MSSTISLFTKLAVGTFGAGLGGYALYDTIVQTVGLRGECVVDIVGADLQVRSNDQLDRFSKPDIQVSCLHGKAKRMTQIEKNCYNPRFLFRSKMPYFYNEGFAFTVLDVDRVNGNEVIGRCFVDATTAKTVMKDKTPLLLSLGDGIGVLKVRLRESEGPTTEKSLDEL